MFPLFRSPNACDVGTVSQFRTIKEGDLVIAYESPQSMKSVLVEPKGHFQTRHGTFPQKEWIGQPFGVKVVGKGGKGWVMLLAPTPELWTLVLRHRTQILYIADISVICLNLELRPGQVVLESGTGSASLTHSLARAVAPGGHVYTYEFHQERAGEGEGEEDRASGGGHVYTYEFHQERADEARKELVAHGLGCTVTVTHRDIMVQGFPLEVHQGSVDAVFLDLPGPWKVVPNAAQCLRPNGRFCSFSPCIEQVQRTCEDLRANGFTDVQTIEVLLREHEVRSERLFLSTDSVLESTLRGPLNPGGSGRGGSGSGSGYIMKGSDVCGPAAKLVKTDDGSESPGGAPPRDQSTDQTEITAPSPPIKKQRIEGAAMDELDIPTMGGREETERSDPATAPQDSTQQASASVSAPRDRTEQTTSEGILPEAAVSNGAMLPPPAPSSSSAARGRGVPPHSLPAGADGVAAGGMPYSMMVTTRPHMDARGHTGYLTFARKFV